MTEELKSSISPEQEQEITNDLIALAQKHHMIVLVVSGVLHTELPDGGAMLDQFSIAVDVCDFTAAEMKPVTDASGHALKFALFLKGVY